MAAEIERAGAGESLFHRLRFTPLRDVLRGRITARLDIDALVASENLPRPLPELVRDVLRRTRLARIEKVDVARELVAHFQDGVEAGSSAEDLKAAFGDARHAARLIRRAKTRGRSNMSKAMMWAARTLLLLLGLAVAAYVLLAVRVYVGKPNVARNYLAEINADARTVPEVQRAWPVYRQAALTTTAWPTEVSKKDLRPTSAHWAELSAFVAENQEAIGLYRRAARMPEFGAVYGTTDDPELEFRHESDRDRKVAEAQANAPAEPENPLLIKLLMPQLTIMREASRLMGIDAYAAAEAGDAKRVMDDLATLFGIAEHAEQMPFLISDLVALAALAAATDQAGELLDSFPDLLSEEQLIELSHRLAGLLGGGRLRVRIGRERTGFEDLLQRIYTDNGRGDGHLTASSINVYTQLMGSGLAAGEPGGADFAVPLLSAFVAGREEMRARYDELMNAAEAEAQTVLWRKSPSAVDAEMERLAASPTERIRYLPITMLFPSLSHCSVVGELATQRRDAALTAIALRLHHRRTGAWPRSLDELTPRLLPGVPLDRYDGKPLKYRLIDGRPVLYSIGVDRDDDGGRAPKKGDASKWRPASALTEPAALPHDAIPDGDWVLWPPAD